MRQFVAVAVICLVPGAVRADDVAAARQHYEEGTKDYDLGRYLDAAKEYEVAYSAKPDPAILYNIGQAYRLAGDKANAIRSYRSYLRRAPDAENRAEVESRLADLQKALDAEATSGEHAVVVEPPASVVASPAPAPTEAGRIAERQVARSNGRTKRIAGVIVAAFGIVTLAGGIASGVVASQDADALSRINDMMEHFDGTKEHAGMAAQSAEIALFALGGAATLTGIVLFAVGQHEAHVARIRAEVSPQSVVF